MHAARQEKRWSIPVLVARGCSWEERGHPGLNRGPLDLQSNAPTLNYTPSSANLCFVFLRNGYENAWSRNIQNGTDHSRLQNSQTIFLFTSLKKRTPGLNRGPLDLQSNAPTLNYTPSSANLCFVFLRNGYENAWSRNIQNGTDHTRLRNSQTIFLFTSLKKRTPGFEPGTSRPAVECSNTELYSLVS
ncbi:hypothetical protein TNCV_4292311 [Trichonephila clavipes]|uniref:Uncharacterized protein n=1 Tax=Trichonephila clavipes TaxID=2585209 RepID=A0A8X6UVD5_TRICX|nr:hypothetical protein TNCV_4292311 [Trichonephila clavipes]